MTGECVNDLEWVWDTSETTSNSLLKHENKEVCFHPDYSSGTAAVRGNQPCSAGRNYFWEIEMLTPLYGTDVMVGVGTSKVDLQKYRLQFGSLLGSDEESWGYSYRGFLLHNGVLRQYGSGFGQGSIVGVHLDMWLGCLTFYLNRRSLGVAFTSLKVPALYPMVCSTAARCAMRVVSAISYTSSLQLHCLQVLGTKRDLVKKLHLVPGLRAYTKKAFWLFPSTEEATDALHLKGGWNNLSSESGCSSSIKSSGFKEKQSDCRNHHLADSEASSIEGVRSEQIDHCCEDEGNHERHVHAPHEIITGGVASDVIINRYQLEEILNSAGVNVEIYLDNNLYVGYEIP